MNSKQCIAEMRTNTATIRQLTLGISAAQARWKPDPSSWSMLEVVNHLADEERYDFRVRLDHILHQPGVNPPSIDPGGWVTERAYNSRQLEPSVQDFLDERENSLAWLHELRTPDWEATFSAPWGTIRAGDMMAAWVAHDLLHMRQLLALRYGWTVQQMSPFRVDYAGEW